MKKTAWFSVKNPPVRSGWFEGRYDKTDGIGRMYWYDTELGEWTMARHDGAMVDSFFGNVWQKTEQWRGLTEKAA